MQLITNRLYKGKALLNVLANSIDNAKAIYEAAEGHVVVGVLSKDYPDAATAVTAMKQYGEAIDDAVSIGLGAGDNRQAAVVAEIAKQYAGTHINQVFTAVGATSANAADERSWINSLVSPSGKPGFVNISTGPISAAATEKAIVPVEAAIAIIRDMGGHALKYFPMGGLSKEDEYRAVAKACGKAGFALEPTGGIDMENFEPIVRIALEANVPIIIPHVYTSIIDETTGATKVDDVAKLTTILKQLVDEYER